MRFYIQKMRVRLLSLLFALAASLPAAAQVDFNDMFDRALLFPHCLSLKADFAYNGWVPNESFMLNYYTEGIQFFKFEVRFTHKIPFLPEVLYKYETNFISNNNQEELLAVHNQASTIENIYKKFLIAAGFWKRLDYFNPYRSNSFFELSYSKETFYIEVSPSTSGLYYAPYSGDISDLGQNKLSMFTKFEEIQGTFKTPGIAIMPLIFSVLFMDSQYDIIDLSYDERWETRLGAYWSFFQKPYMVNQIESYGSTSGYYDVIYNAKFNAIGMVEKYSFYDRWFKFDLQTNLGIAWIKLRENEILSDSVSSLYFHYKVVPNIGFHFSLLKQRINLAIAAGVEWGFMWGGQYSETTEKFETTSFLNDDFIFKVTASLTLNI